MCVNLTTLLPWWPKLAGHLLFRAITNQCFCLVTGVSYYIFVHGCVLRKCLMNVFLQTILDIIIQFLCPIAGVSPRFDRKKQLAHCLVGISPFLHGKIVEIVDWLDFFCWLFHRRVVWKNIIYSTITGKKHTWRCPNCNGGTPLVAMVSIHINGHPMDDLGVPIRTCWRHKQKPPVRRAPGNWLIYPIIIIIIPLYTLKHSILSSLLMSIVSHHNLIVAIFHSFPVIFLWFLYDLYEVSPAGSIDYGERYGDITN